MAATNYRSSNRRDRRRGETMHERKFTADAEMKFAQDASAMTFSGYGAYFGNVDSYGDVIVPGAFAKTLAEARKSGRWPAMLAQHGGLTADDMTPVGVWTEMKEDARGLYVEGKLAETQRGHDLYALMKMQPRPAIDGMSIGYRPVEFTLRAKPEEPRRTLKSVQLFEVSVVTFPANDLSRVQQVKADEMTIRDFERALTRGMLPPLSDREAKALLAHGFKGLGSGRDDGSDAAALAERLRRNIDALRI